MNGMMSAIVEEAMAPTAVAPLEGQMDFLEDWESDEPTPGAVPSPPTNEQVIEQTAEQLAEQPVELGSAQSESMAIISEASPVPAPPPDPLPPANDPSRADNPTASEAATASAPALAPPGNSDRDEFMDLINRKYELVESISKQRDNVAVASQTVVRLREQASAARKAWQEATDELTATEKKLVDVIIQLDHGIRRNVVLDDLPESEGGGSATISGDIHRDPAESTDLEVLGITPGRLESIRQAECRPGRQCQTIDDLEELIRRGGLLGLKGIGPKAVDAITDQLLEWRRKNPMPELKAERISRIELVDGKWNRGEWHSGAIARADGKPRLLSESDSWLAGWDKKNAELGPVVKTPDAPESATVPQSDPLEPSDDSDQKETPQVTQETPQAQQSAANDQPLPANSAPSKKRGRKKKAAAEPAVEVTGKPTGSSWGVPDDLLPADATESEHEEAVVCYTAGCEAAISEFPVTANPYKQGTWKWRAWDRGWQDCQS